MSGASGGGGLLGESSRRRRSLRFTDSPRPSRGALGLCFTGSAWRSIAGGSGFRRATLAGTGLHGDGFAEFQGGADELLHLAAEVRQFAGDFTVVALEGLQPVEFRLERVNLL